MFTEYQSKPVVRKARKILATDRITKLTESEATYRLTAAEQGTVSFKSYEAPKVGDYIVYLNSADVYHCSAKVFAERNIIPSEVKEKFK